MNYNRSCDLLFPSFSNLPTENNLYLTGSPLLPFFNHAYNRIRQNGALARIKAKWEDKDKSLKCEGDSLEPISIEKMGSLLLMVLGGIILASCIFILENFYKTEGARRLPQV